MARAVGLGGAFLRARDPKALVAWYEKHLGLEPKHGAFIFSAAEQRGDIALSFFSRENSYFPIAQPAMLNLQVDDLGALLTRLRAAGVEVDPKQESHEYGQFGWITDPEGNRVELWEPAKE